MYLAVRSRSSPGSAQHAQPVVAPEQRVHRVTVVARFRRQGRGEPGHHAVRPGNDRGAAATRTHIGKEGEDLDPEQRLRVVPDSVVRVQPPEGSTQGRDRSGKGTRIVPRSGGRSQVPWPSRSSTAARTTADPTAVNTASRLIALLIPVTGVAAQVAGSSSATPADPGQPGPHPTAHHGRLVWAERTAQPDDALSGELDALLLAEHAPTIGRFGARHNRFPRHRRTTALALGG